MSLLWESSRLFQKNDKLRMAKPDHDCRALPLSYWHFCLGEKIPQHISDRKESWQQFTHFLAIEKGETENLNFENSGKQQQLKPLNITQTSTQKSERKMSAFWLFLSLMIMQSSPSVLAALGQLPAIHPAALPLPLLNRSFGSPSMQETLQTACNAS